jgi:hypothetical protein
MAEGVRQNRGSFLEGQAVRVNLSRFAGGIGRGIGLNTQGLTHERRF